MLSIAKLSRVLFQLAMLAALLAGSLGFNPLAASANPAAVGWLPVVIDTAADTTKPISLAVDSLGRPHVVYVAGAAIHYAVFENQRWNERATIAGTADYLHLALDYRNYAHICYMQKPSGKGSLFYAVYTSSMNTGPAVAAGDSGYYCSIDVNDGGYPSIAYFDQAFTALKIIKKGRLSWDPPTTVVDVGSSAYNFGSLKISAAGYPHLAYCTGSALGQCTSLNYSYYNGTAWNHEVVDNTSGAGYYPSLAFSPGRTVKISYHLLNTSLKIAARLTASSWNKSVVESGDVGLYSALAIDANDTAHIAYYDETNSAAKYARVTSLGTTSETLASAGVVGTFTALGLAPDGSPHIAFQDVGKTNAFYMGKQPLSDLLVSGLWKDRAQTTLTAAIKNDGAETQLSSFNAQWFVDNVLTATNTISTDLLPDTVVNTNFDLAAWTCSAPSDVMKVCLTTAQTEFNTGNNCLETTWVCDTTPPVISSGPTAANITTTGFTITWVTNELATSEVRFSTQPRLPGITQNAAGTRTSHSIPVTGLRANTPYYVTVRSVNSANLATTSREILVRTAAPSSVKPADPTITVRRAATRFEQYEFSANFADTAGIAKITFNLDSQPVGSTFSPKRPASPDQANASGTTGSYALQLAPSAMGATRAAFYSQHQGQVVALMTNGQTFTWPFLFEPVRTSVPVEGWFVAPNEGQKYYQETGGTISPGKMVGVDVYGAEFEWECTWNQDPDSETDPNSPPVNCGDAAKPLSTVRFYLDGVYLGEDPTPTADRVYHYDINFGGKPLGNRKIEARLIASDGTTLNLQRTITFALGQPSLSISRVVTRNQHFFDVTLSVANAAQATGCATLFDLTDWFVGFQAAQPTGAYTYTPRYSVGHESSLLIEFDGGLLICAGETKNISYKLLPVLYADMNSSTYRIGHLPVDTHYARPGSGSVYVPFSVETTQINDSALPSGKGTVASSVHNAFKRSDYILITSPAALVTRFNHTRSNQVMATMADLALLKQGVLAFWPADGAMETLNKLLHKDSAWSSRLHSNFQTRGKGYVLIVGESEIVPSDTTGPFSVTWSDSGHEHMPVHYSDNTYAHTGGNGAPDLLLGRIIGNTPEALVFAMQTSIQVHNTAGWNRSDVYLASGVGNQEEVMQADANTAANNFTEDGWSVSLHHWEDEAFLRSYNFTFDEFDGYASGDIDGDGYGEFITASRANDKVYIIKGDGSAFTLFNLDFEQGDALTAGDFDNDGLDEICIGDRGDQIRCYSGAGAQELSFEIDFSAYERIAIGNVLTSSPGNEIIMADDNDILRIFNSAGTQIQTIDIGAKGYDFADHDLLAVGNVDTGIGVEEIVFTDRTHDKIVVLGADGTLKKAIDIDFDYGDGLAVGKVMPGDREQILIADRNNHIYIYLGQDVDFTRSYTLYNTIYANWEQYDGLAVRLVPGNDNDEIVQFDRGDRIRVVDPHYPINAINLFKTNAQNKDLIWLMAHGSAGGMDPAQRLYNFPANFGSAHPIVTAFSCLTGDYEGNSDNSLAEKYLAAGAGIYFGSTEVSPVTLNSMASRVFFTHNWLAGTSFAKAMQAFKQEHWDDTDLSGFWHLWVNEYNLYGDPKFDIFSATLPAASASLAPQAASDNPIVVDLLPYTVTPINGFDNIQIPGGGTYLVEGAYQVPTYKVRVEYPAGVHIQDVALTAQSNLTSQTGLKLPLMAAVPLEAGSRQAVLGNLPAKLPQMSWSPDFPKPFSWSVDVDGEVETLLITLYPFSYAPESLYSEYYRHFEFTVQSITAPVSIVTASTDKESYAVGEAVYLELLVNNSAPTPADVTISAAIHKVGDSQTLYGFDLVTMQGLNGKGKINLSWDSTAALTGSYTLVVELKDTNNQTVDRITTAFTLGKMEAATTSLNVTPTFFKPGAAITAQLKITSAGSLPMDGTAVVEIRDRGGNLVQEFTQAITALQPGQWVTFSPTWDSTGASEEEYAVLGYARFESQQSAVIQVPISTKMKLFLPTIRR